MSQSAMSVMCRAGIPEVLPAVMPAVPAVPEFLPAPPPDFVLPARLPAGLSAEGRAALAAALQGTVPGGQRPDRGELMRAAGPACWDEGECARLLRFLGSADDPRRRQGRVYPLDYMLALPLVAGMAGDGELDAAGEWIASAPEELLLRLGAPRDRAGRARRPDATALGRVLAAVDQCQYDDALCGWVAARARAQCPGLRKHLRCRAGGRGFHRPRGFSFLDRSDGLRWLGGLRERVDPLPRGRDRFSPWPGRLDFQAPFPPAADHAGGGVQHAVPHRL